jgi:hypothetical protein
VEQFKNPQTTTYPLESVMFPLDVPNKYLGINLIVKPIAMKCLLIVFDVQAKQGLSRRVGVMLPGPYPQDFDLFQNLPSFDGTEMEIRPFEINFDTKFDIPNLLHALWHSDATTA